MWPAKTRGHLDKAAATGEAGAKQATHPTILHLKTLGSQP